MSGHSKWSTIKRKKGAEDARRGKLFTRLACEITIAARNGGDPSSNSSLRLAIDKARASNMPKDNIERAIKRGTGELEGGEVEEIIYEGYGPHGVAVLVKCLTDNRNRTIADVRRVCLLRFHSSVGAHGLASLLQHQSADHKHTVTWPNGKSFQISAGINDSRTGCTKLRFPHRFQGG